VCNVTGEEMMCRFDPTLQEKFVKKKGFMTMQMKGREYKGYGYISQDAIKSKKILTTGYHLHSNLINGQKQPGKK